MPGQSAGVQYVAAAGQPAVSYGAPEYQQATSAAPGAFIGGQPKAQQVSNQNAYGMYAQAPAAYDQYGYGNGYGAAGYGGYDTGTAANPWLTESSYGGSRYPSLPEKRSLPPPPAEQNPLLKTKMCRRMKEPGGCRWGDKCSFAHTQSELKEPDYTKSGGGILGPDGQNPSGGGMTHAEKPAIGPPQLGDPSVNIENGGSDDRPEKRLKQGP